MSFKMWHICNIYLYTLYWDTSTMTKKTEGKMWKHQTIGNKPVSLWFVPLSQFRNYNSYTVLLKHHKRILSYIIMLYRDYKTQKHKMNDVLLCLLWWSWPEPIRPKLLAWSGMIAQGRKLTDNIKHVSRHFVAIRIWYLST